MPEGWNKNRHRLVALLAAAALSFLLLACGKGKQTEVKNPGEALRFELAELYVAKGVQRAAVPLLQKILAENPKDIRARVLYANVLRDLSLYPQAEREYRYALQLAPRYAPTHAGLGILCDLQRQSKTALRHHRTAVQLAPADARYRNNLGFSLYLAGETDAAIIELERALAMDPSLAVAYNNLGFAYGRNKQYEQAERTFRSALGEASALLNMALIYEENGEPKRAEELRAQAYAMDPALRPDEEAEDL